MSRRRLAALAALALAAAALARGPIGDALADVLIEPPPGDPQVIELLSGIDFVPPRSSLDGALGDAALDELIALAGGDGAAADPGVRLRALRALALYPDDATRAALVDAVRGFAAADRGVDTLYLRAAMDALAQVAAADAVDELAPLLDHPSRDVRAGAAGALGATGAVEAVPALRARLQIEPVEQVRLALSAAIRVLEG